MTNTTVHFLASYYNMTIHSYRKRKYLLEVNPKYTDDSYDDYLNVIDARWIDIQTGLFIDITAVRPKEGFPNTICSKDQHEERVSTAQVHVAQSTNLTHRVDPRSISTTRQSVRRPGRKNTIRLHKAAHNRIWSSLAQQDQVLRVNGYFNIHRHLSSG